MNIIIASVPFTSYAIRHITNIKHTICEVLFSLLADCYQSYTKMFFISCLCYSPLAPPLYDCINLCTCNWGIRTYTKAVRILRQITLQKHFGLMLNFTLMTAHVERYSTDIQTFLVFGY